MKRVAAALTAVAAALALLTGCAAKQPEELTPPFWQAVSPEGEQAWLLGSMHVGKKNTAYPDYVLEAFDACSSVICEVDTIALEADQSALTECLSLLLCPDGTTASDRLGEDYAEIKSFFLKNGMYSPVYELYMPSLWTTALSNKTAEKCGLDAALGTEAVFLERAKAQGKTIIEAESARAQYEVLAASPEGLDVYTLREAAREGFSAQQASLEELYTAWAEFDSASLEKLLEDEEIPEEYARQYEDYCRMMYADRQKVMAQCLMDADKSGGVFMFVGALHYYAEPDIITLLEDAGWTVSEVRPADSAAAA